MSPLFFREHTIKIWESSFEPYLDPSQWPEYDGPEYVPLPSLKKMKKGRSQKKRLKGTWTRVKEGLPLIMTWVILKLMQTR
jgi:hypothetical protein